MRLIIASAVSFLMTVSACAEPLEHWRDADPVATEWLTEGRKAIRDFGSAAKSKPTILMVVQDGRVVASFGDVRRKVNMQSVRKSLVSALYGVAVSEGRISLTSTLAELGIDDSPPSLTDSEKQATVRDLLMARSGVYHAAAYETADMGDKRPKRGSHSPGSFWYYNNWDFNALGTIYRKATGEGIFESFERHIARPIGMEDFLWPVTANMSRNRNPFYQAYPLQPKCARCGPVRTFLFLNGGQWQGKQIIPAAWIRNPPPPIHIPIGVDVAMAISGGRCSRRNGDRTRSSRPAMAAKSSRSFPQSGL